MGDGNDDIAISWMAGGFRFERNGRTTVQTRAGAACIMPLDRVWRAETPDGAWTVCIQLPKAPLAAFVGDVEDLPPDAINRDTPEGGLLLDYLSAITRRPPSPAMAPMVSRHIMDLLAVSIGCTREVGRIAGRRGVRAARLRAIKQHIRENLSHPLLSAENAGRHFKLSPRYIRRLFATEDRSFSDYLAEQRLALVYRRLCDPRSAGTPIADIAFEAGLAEPSTFYRRFKARYGINPSDLRTCPFTCAKLQR
ncbi:AraC family transcriptional regulator [Luteimonas suaedae]|uniref:AraC family transcriptional regulator n=1 Tax=Luteimonas suaedae TaxID=2605430 RepID=UPI0011EC5DB3|nr:AraC family transcriptional regulator [Luteimonas suaedae]